MNASEAKCYLCGGLYGSEADGGLCGTWPRDVHGTLVCSDCHEKRGLDPDGKKLVTDIRARRSALAAEKKQAESGPRDADGKALAIGDRIARVSDGRVATVLGFEGTAELFTARYDNGTVWVCRANNWRHAPPAPEPVAIGANGEELRVGDTIESDLEDIIGSPRWTGYPESWRKLPPSAGDQKTPGGLFERLEFYAHELLAEQVKGGGQGSPEALQACRDAVQAGCVQVFVAVTLFDRHICRLERLGCAIWECDEYTQPGGALPLMNRA